MTSMTFQMRVLASAFVLLALATTADAATLFTPPMSYQLWFGTDVECKITNVANSPTTVRARSMSQQGNVQQDSGNVVLAPHESVELSGGNGAGRTYCRFDVQGSKRRVRASICRVSLGSDGCQGALPAQ